MITTPPKLDNKPPLTPRLPPVSVVEIWESVFLPLCVGYGSRVCPVRG